MSKYWKEVAILGAVAIAGIFYGLWRYELIRHSRTAEHLQTAQAVILAHESNVKKAEKVNHDYQNDINKLNANIRRLRALPDKCITITPPSDIHPQPGQGRGYAGENGISSRWLYEYAADAELLRIERNSCKDFVNGLYSDMK